MDLAVKAWNLMGGAVDWGALPLLVEMLGVEDVEGLVVRLSVIRNWRAENRG